MRRDIHSLQGSVVLAIVCLCSIVNSYANQDAAPADGSTTESVLTLEHVDQLRREAAEAPGIADTAKKTIDDAYQAALTHLKAAAALAERAASFQADSASVNERVAESRRLLEEASEDSATVSTSGDLATLEQELAQLELTLANQRNKHAELVAEPQARAQRRKEIRTRLAAISEALTDSQGDAVVAAPASEPAVVAAKAIENAARKVAMDQELLALRAELAKYDASDAVDLVRLRTDLAAKLLVRSEREVAALAKAVKERREAAADKSVRQARLESLRATPVLKSYAERNHALAETAQSIAGQLSEAEIALNASRETYTDLQKQFQLTRTKIETVGLTSAVGALLRKQRSTLPDPTDREASIVARQTLINEIQYQLFDYADEREELSELDATIEKVVNKARPQSPSHKTHLATAARELLERKREYLDLLIKTSNKYFDTLVELDTSDRQIVSLTGEYTEFIDERVLWIRSGRLLSKDFSLDESDAMLLSRAAWMDCARDVYRDVVRFPVGYIAGIVVFGFALAGGRRLRRHVASVGTIAEKANCRSLLPTFDALAVTILLALIWPLGCLALGWRLERIEGDLVRSLGSGFRCMGLLWAPTEVLRQLCRPKGLGESHFGWSNSVMQLLGARLRWFLFATLPVVFVTAMLLSFDTTHGSDAVERVTFICGALISAIFAAQTLRADGVLREYMAYNSSKWADNLRWLWPLLGAAVPLVLGILAFVGYYYTAQVLAWQVFATCCLMATVVIVKALLLRALMLRRRSLSMEQAKARAAEASAAEGDAAAEGAVAGIVTSAPQADLTTHSKQTQRLVTTGLFAATAVGLWVIWVQVLPALGMLDRYPLWRNSAVSTADASSNVPVNHSGPAPMVTEPSAASANDSAEDSVTTLSDLGVAILVAFVTFVLARNGPGLLEISILQQLPLEPSVRYAITTLVSYTIVLVGIAISCSTIGLQWAQIQWLATALTFGLAFGLQEMFANFVAGLIILLERPIRVGDVVTVDDITGVVSRIRIRATSITNWDRKEYVVPNKEFITGRLLNWTLSDKVNRIVINIGVAYGSDTDKAREILLAVANDHPLILDDPPSIATFEGFGDNSLSLVLRTYLPTLDNRLDVIHQLHTAIDKAFRTAGIEIAFPQRDLHIRSAPAALGVALDGDQAEDAGTKKAA